IPAVTHTRFLGAFAAVIFHVGIISRRDHGHTWLWHAGGVQCVLVVSEFHGLNYRQMWRAFCVIPRSWFCAVSEWRSPFKCSHTHVFFELHELLARLPCQLSCQQCRSPFGRQWPRKVISLAIFALQFLKQGNLLNCLYPLRNHVQPKIIGHGQNGPRNLHTFSTIAHAADEGAVYLQGVEGKTV